MECSLQCFHHLRNGYKVNGIAEVGRFVPAVPWGWGISQALHHPSEVPYVPPTIIP